MVTVEVTLNLPEDLVTRAQQAGVLTTERMIGLIEKELEREFRVNRLFKTMDRLQAVEPQLDQDIIDEEIQDHRNEKRAQRLP